MNRFVRSQCRAPQGHAGPGGHARVDWHSYVDWIARLHVQTVQPQSGEAGEGRARREAFHRCLEAKTCLVGSPSPDVNARTDPAPAHVFKVPALQAPPPSVSQPERTAP